MLTLCLVGNLFQYIFTVKEGRGFFKSPVLGLDEEEPQEDKFDSEPADVYELGMTVEKKIQSEAASTNTYVVFPR